MNVAYLDSVARLAGLFLLSVMSAGAVAEASNDDFSFLQGTRLVAADPSTKAVCDEIADKVFFGAGAYVILEPIVKTTDINDSELGRGLQGCDLRSFTQGEISEARRMNLGGGESLLTLVGTGEVMYSDEYFELYKLDLPGSSKSGEEYIFYRSPQYQYFDKGRVREKKYFNEGSFVRITQPGCMVGAVSGGGLVVGEHPDMKSMSKIILFDNKTYFISIDSQFSVFITKELGHGSTEIMCYSGQ